MRLLKSRRPSTSTPASPYTSTTTTESTEANDTRQRERTLGSRSRTEDGRRHVSSTPPVSRGILRRAKTEQRRSSSSSSFSFFSRASTTSLVPVSSHAEEPPPLAPASGYTPTDLLPLPIPDDQPIFASPIEDQPQPSSSPQPSSPPPPSSPSLDPSPTLRTVKTSTSSTPESSYHSSLNRHSSTTSSGVESTLLTPDLSLSTPLLAPQTPRSHTSFVVHDDDVQVRKEGWELLDGYELPVPRYSPAAEARPTSPDSASVQTDAPTISSTSTTKARVSLRVSTFNLVETARVQEETEDEGRETVKAESSVNRLIRSFSRKRERAGRERDRGRSFPHPPVTQLSLENASTSILTPRRALSLRQPDLPRSRTEPELTRIARTSSLSAPRRQTVFDIDDDDLFHQAIKQLEPAQDHKQEDFVGSLHAARELVGGERRYSSILETGIEMMHESGVTRPTSLGYHLPRLLRLSLALSSLFEKNPSIEGIADAFLSLEDELTEECGDWSTQVGPVIAAGSGEVIRARDSLHFSDIIIAPTQRVARYELLFRSILRRTPPQSLAHAKVLAAVEASQRLAAECDRRQTHDLEKLRRNSNGHSSGNMGAGSASPVRGKLQRPRPISTVGGSWIRASVG